MNAYEAGKKLLRGNYSAYTPDFAAQGRKAGAYCSTPQVGDVVEFYSNGKQRIGHTGIVTAAAKKNGMWTIETVEGNSSPGLFTTDGGCVSIHRYEFLPSQIGGANRINGFLRPDFCAETCSAEQLVSIARSQVGYCEKASNENLEDFRANPGKANYTKYGEFAKASGWGYNPAEWCGMFVSWCAYMACKTAHDYTPGWIRQDDASWSYRKDGDIVRDQWLYDGGRWYVFDGSGRMITGWYHDSDGNWYYLANDGGMCASQWVADGRDSYYMTHSGAMATNAYIKADKPLNGVWIYYWVGENGKFEEQWNTAFPHLETYPLAW